MRIAINGCGRIGKTFLRTLLADKDIQGDINVVAINVGYGDPDNIVYMLKYDTVMPTFTEEMAYKDGVLTVGKYTIAIFSECNFDKLDWRQYDVDWVVECTGVATERKQAEKHIAAGAKKVLISAPAQGEDVSIIPGVNDEAYKPNEHTIISLGSCTTNAFLPTLKVIHRSIGIERAMMTTIHAYTNSQGLVDEFCGKSKIRRSRSAPENLVPTSTGASKMVDTIMPDLGKRVSASAIRVPVPIGSIIDLTFTGKKEFSIDTIHTAFNEAAQRDMKGIVAISDEPCVSSDYAGNPYSVTIDAPCTQVTGDMGKVFGWYDNEWGYSERMKDFLKRCCAEG